MGRGSRRCGRESRRQGRGSRRQGRGSRRQGRGSRRQGRGSRRQGRGSTSGRLGLTREQPLQPLQLVPDGGDQLVDAASDDAAARRHRLDPAAQRAITPARPRPARRSWRRPCSARARPVACTVGVARPSRRVSAGPPAAVNAAHCRPDPPVRAGAGQGRSGPVRAGQGRSGPVRAGQGARLVRDGQPARWAREGDEMADERGQLGLGCTPSSSASIRRNRS